MASIFPYLAYADTLHLPTDPVLKYRTDIIWVDWQRDVRAAIAYWHQGELSLVRWMNSLRGEKMWAIDSKTDWRPGFALLLALVRKLWDHMRQAYN